MNPVGSNDGQRTLELREVATGLLFPEGPIALPDGSFLVTEIAASRLSRISASGKVTTVAVPGGSPAGAAIGPDGHCYVCNGGGTNFNTKNGLTLPRGSAGGKGRVERINLETGRVEVLYGDCDGTPLSAPNDLVFDQHGGFWFTDHGQTRETTVDRGWVYYAKPDGSRISKVIGPMVGPNGIGLSPDGRRLYVAETGPARLWGFDLDEEPGTVAYSDGAEFRRMGHFIGGPGGYQMFDSLAVDADGWICIATLLNGGITAFSPDGRQLQHVPLPDRFTTNVCFGGTDPNRAYATLGSTGKLVGVAWPRAGLSLHFSGRTEPQR